MKEFDDIAILDENLSVDKVFNAVRSEEDGAIALFIGTIRNHNKGKKVVKLDFEVYDQMAIKELRKIASKVRSSNDISDIVIHHRKGNLSIGDIAVIIGVSAHHRKEAFVACEKVINMLKETVPIWKKEYLQDGSYWIGARP